MNQERPLFSRVPSPDGKDSGEEVLRSRKMDGSLLAILGIQEGMGPPSSRDVELSSKRQMGVR